MSSLIDDIKNSFLRRDLLMRIIFINIVIYIVFLLFYVFCFLLKLPNPLDYISTYYLMLPADVTQLLIHPWTVITYMFLHNGVFHILFNMLVLYWFGGIYQEYLGKQKFIYTYFLSGIFGGLFYVLCYNIFPYFSDSVGISRALGASAGVMGIVFGAATLLPNYTIVLAIFGPIRLKYIALFYFLIDLAGITSSNSGGHLAHIGGALFGFIFIKQLQRGNDWTKYPVKILEGITGLFKKKKLKVVHKRDSVTQEEIDKVLDKISQSGYENLTAKEREILFKAGRQ